MSLDEYKEVRPALELLVSGGSYMRSAIIKSGWDKLDPVLYNIGYNFLYIDLKLDADIKERLQPIKPLLRLLVDSIASKRKKIEKILETEEFFNTLLPLALKFTFEQKDGQSK